MIPNEISIPRQFVERHLANVSARELRIYLYLQAQPGSGPATCKDISQGLGMNPTDVGQGLRKLAGRGLVRLTYRKKSGWIKAIRL